ncbi:MBL fold metallo-hydrolase [Acinetobacter sp. S40]|uniref:MBL fold metallo-hydrolase n=1 Tax=Acinetobacter sp. S40 TaxID=2767434 RepID=UPI00190BF228|nr:MBL fold metallo-hydrolase [Acinetobacter sp. S40]MBJ9984310.1 MBL fold metallo-hydrolase [Acinetobacter sp. S40]
MIYKIHHLHCGTMCPACAPLVSQKGLKAHIICHCLLLETDRGLVLIDTGLGLQDYLHPQQRLGTLLHKFGKIENNPKLSAIHQIQELGLNPKDVQHIFVSHLDFDHAGGISDFPQATVHVLASEFNATQSLSFSNRIRYKTAQFKNHRFWNFIEHMQGESWFNLEKVSGLPLFQDEILMIPLLGHSAGHSGIAIKQEQGWILFCGDAYFSHLELDPKQKLKGLHVFESMLAHDNKMRLNNLKQLQYLAQQEPKIELICAHDIQEFLRYRPLS